MALAPLAGRGEERTLRARAPSKLRRTLFRERLDAFLDLGTAHAVAMAAVGGLFIQPAAGEFVDRALHAAHRDRRIAAENARELRGIQTTFVKTYCRLSLRFCCLLGFGDGG